MLVTTCTECMEALLIILAGLWTLSPYSVCGVRNSVAFTVHTAWSSKLQGMSCAPPTAASLADIACHHCSFLVLLKLASYHGAQSLSGSNYYV